MNIYKNLNKIYVFTLLIVTVIIFYRFIGDYNFKLNNLNLFLSYSFLIISVSFIYIFFKFNIKDNQFPLFPLIILYLIFAYGFSFELINFYLITQKQSIITKAYLVMNIGIILFGIGFFVSKNFLKRKKELYLLEFKNFNFILFFGLSLVLFNILDKIIQILPNNLNQIHQPTISMGCAIIFYYFIYSNKIYKFIYLIPVIIIIFLEILKSSYVYPATILLQYFLIYVILKKKLPLVQLLLFFLFFVFLHSFKLEFREYLSKSKNLQTYDRTEIFLNVYNFNNLTKRQIDGHPRNRSEDNFWRITHSYISLLKIVEKSPDQVPFYYGETYKILLTKFIPRIFWEDKPSDEYANAAGRRYDVLGKDDRNTSWNFPILNETYANYGFYGVFFIMLSLGILVRILTNLFSINNFNNFESFIGVYICSTAFFWEPHLSLVFGGLHLVILFLYAITIFFSLIIKKIII